MEIKNKFNNIIEKCNEYKNCIFKYLAENKFIISIFAIIFILLAFQHSVVTMYYDDYGNASLSYEIKIDGVEGTDYNMSQLAEWAVYIYNNWGGRILYAICFIIPLLQNGVGAYMFAQTIVITLIIYFMYKIADYKMKNKNRSWLLPVLIFILYTCIDMTYLRHGIYWASASVLYIWPLLPLFMFIYLYMKTCDKIKNGEKAKLGIVIPVMLLLNFFATFSQEQVGVAVIAFELGYIVLHHFKDIKRYLVVDLSNFVCSIISYLALFLAPGNWVRMDTNTEFASLDFVGKIVKNFPELIRGIFLEKMNIYIYFLSVLFIYVVYLLIKGKYKENKKYFLMLIPVAVFITEMVVMTIVGSFYNQILFYTCSVLWLVCAFIVSLFYFYQKNHIEFCSLYVAAACSVFCLLMSPTLVLRTFLPCMFFLMIIIIRLVMDALEDKHAIVRYALGISIVVIAYSGMKYFIRNYEGYRDNYAITKLNEQILKDYDVEEDGQTLDLYKVEDIWYGSEQPYLEPRIRLWMLEYFGIEEDVSFNWIDIYEDVRES